MKLRRATVLLLIALAALPATPAGAQEAVAEQARLVLLSQTTVGAARRDFRITVEARNVGDRTLRDLALSLWIYNPAPSRSDYQAGLEDEPATTPLLISPLRVRGILRPGDAREIGLSRGLGELDENGLYPVKVQLESEGVAVATLRTALIFIGEKPLVPLNVGVTFVLHEPVRFRPDGTFVSDGLERSIEPGGRLDTIVSALEERPLQATLVVSPILLEQLRSMRSGYRILRVEGAEEVPADSPAARLAAAMLQRLRALARSQLTELVTLPYSNPSVPSLAVPGLAADLEFQIERGRERVEEILGVTPSERVFRPPASEITPESLDGLNDVLDPPNGERGVLLLDAETAPPPENLPLSPSGTARVGGIDGLDAITPDPALDRYLTPTQAEAHLWAQRALGDLAAIYFEQPSVVRAVAVLFDESTTLQPGFLAPFLRGLASPPPKTRWARPAKATQLVEAARPAADDRRRLRRIDPATFSPAFVVDVTTAKASIEQFDSMGGPSDLQERLRTMLLVAEARDFLRREDLGRGFIGAADGILDREFAKVKPPEGSSITLTSRDGLIPVTLRKEADYDVRVRVTLVSPRLEFLEGATREVLLQQEAQVLTFPVRAKTTGGFKVVVEVETPGAPGRRLIGESQIVVRSTAYNRVALFVTIGAALFLALWWGRRFLRRARS